MTSNDNRRPASAGGTLRASEIGAYLYCRRAWWFERQGRHRSHTEALEAGLSWHRRHGRRVLMAWLIRAGGWGLILAALALAGASVVARLVG